MPVKPVPRPADIVQHVHRVVQERLARYEIKPGERLNEVELATSLSVSRTPVREALNRLSTEGLVSFVPNRGFFARGLEIEDVTNLSELRAGVEGIAVRAACARAPDAAIAAVGASWSRVLERETSIGSTELADEDERFHEQLADLGGNDELVKVIRNINVRIRFIRHCAIDNPRRRQETMADHVEIIAAIKARDAARASALVEKHVTISADDALEVITRGLTRIYLKPAS